ncbi:hypothetical protein GCM10025868_45060 [Angustibacter aerolatus]|uniref:Lipoyl-binding domain-containing protein n=1 Tax=Angustibacter aerolatus TaxID=1162965 RepID=A0ABQ6JRE7_9ACTN|nr:hypothetical protein GCM10025868_45060 [Angustibacter aerolatus]
MSAHDIPADLRYTAEHEWVRAGDDGVLRVGITAYAQDALGDVVFVTLPDTGADVAPGQACGEVESTKSVSDIYAPVTGEVTARNEALDGSPEPGELRPVRRGVDVRGPPGRCRRRGGAARRRGLRCTAGLTPREHEVSPSGSGRGFGCGRLYGIAAG